MTTTPLSLEDYETDVVLKDGQTIHLRTIRSEDLDAMMEMWERLSMETIRMRFFALRKMSRQQMQYQVDVDHEQRFALVAELQGDIIGVGRFDRLPNDPSTAEFAVIVQDDQQGRGIGTTLLRALMAPARDLGVSNFHGDILSENRSMLMVMKKEGFEPSFESYGPTVTATFTTTPTEALLQKAGELERRAANAALSSVMRPESIAVIGASRDSHSVGGVILANLVRTGFEGPIFPVNPDARYVQSIPAYPSLDACPAVPESIYVCVPAEMCAAVVDEAGRLGVRTAVVLAAGFSESGPEGQELEETLIRTARQHGIRLIGPNCMGVLNTDPAVSLNGSLSLRTPPAGGLGLSSQSGALGLTILSAAERLGVGLSCFASIGNRVDISSNDVLQFLEQDEATTGILLYLESFGNPRKFARLARRIGRRKPIVVVKSGQGDATATQALFDQAGVIRVASLNQMFNVAKLLSDQPLPRGNRVALLSNGGGPAALAADACAAAGLKAAELQDTTVQAVREAGAYSAAPVTLHPTSTPQEYGRALSALIADPEVDAVIAVFIPPVLVNADEIGAVIARAAEGSDKPVMVVFMSMDTPPAALADARIPTYVFPESAAGALGHAARYVAWRERDLGHVVTFDDIDSSVARTTVLRALGVGEDREHDSASHGEPWTLTAADANVVLQSFGITTAPSGVARTAEDAGRITESLRGPVVIKPVAAIEKAAAGLVRVGISGPAAAMAALRELQAAVPEVHRQMIADTGWLVQEMVPDGIEMVVGVEQDPTFGPIIVAGFGGRIAGMLGDVAMRIHPLTDVDVEDMLRGLRGYPLLQGNDDTPAADTAALRVLLLRVAAMVEAIPEIVSVDLNPVFARQHGVAVVDSRIVVAAGRRQLDPLTG